MNDLIEAWVRAERHVVLQDLTPTCDARREVRSENPISISLSGDWIISLVNRLRCSRPFITAKKLPVTSYRYGIHFSDSAPTIALLNWLTTLPRHNQQDENVRRAAT